MSDDNTRRDVTDGEHTCSYCGGSANSLLNGEHIWRCSEVIPIEELEQLAEEWEDAQHLFEPANQAMNDCAQELRETINTYGDRNE